MNTLGTWSVLTALALGFAPRAAALSGSGTEADPYVLASVQDLQAMEDHPTAWYVVAHDIDASETKQWNSGAGFVPISSFGGHLDGRGFAIRNLSIHRIDAIAQGLFGQLDGAIVDDLHLVDAEVSGDARSGLLAGGVRFSQVTRCSATGVLTLKPGFGDSKSGGLVGSVGSSHIDRCFADVDVTAGNRVQVGGLIGYLRGVEFVTRLTNSYSLGTVTGTGWKQGNLLGDADGSEVDRCYSSGHGKALIGFNFRNPVITNSYWDQDRGAKSSPFGGKPRTTAEMTRRATFAGWDFDTIWDIQEGRSYPFFRRPRLLVRSIPTLDVPGLALLFALLGLAGLAVLKYRL